jgi:hypothetical protein
MTAFEELGRQWAAERGKAGKLLLATKDVGSQWSRADQVNVVAANWVERAILLGECKWGTDALDRAVVRELLEAKIIKVLKDLPYPIRRKSCTSTWATRGGPSAPLRAGSLARSRWSSIRGRPAPTGR